MIITSKLNKHQHECNIYLILKAFLITNNNMERTHKTLAPKNPPYIPDKTTVNNSKILLTSFNVLSFVFIVSLNFTSPKKYLNIVSNLSFLFGVADKPK